MVQGNAQRDLVLAEFDYMQRAIDKFDEQRLKVRNWAVVIVGAVLALAYQQSSFELSGLAVFAAIAFAVFEGVYISMTMSVIRRSILLEGLLAPDADLAGYRFSVSAAFSGVTTLREAIQLVFRRGRMHIWFFYTMLFFGSAASFVVLWLGRAGVCPDS